MIRRANELADFVVAAAKEYGFDAADVTAVGYSNGANIAGCGRREGWQVVRTFYGLRP